MSERTTTPTPAESRSIRPDSPVRLDLRTFLFVLIGVGTAGGTLATVRFAMADVGKLEARHAEIAL